MADVPNTPTNSGGSTWGTVGNAFTAMGMAASAVNAYYQVESQKYELKAQALALDHQAFMSRLNAQRAESDAQAIMQAGQIEKAGLTLRQGQERAGLIAGQAASGTEAGGSNAEVRASQRLIQKLEAMNLDANTVRASNAARTRSVNSQNEALLAGVSAQNMRGAAGSLNPGLAAFGSLAGSTGQLAARWAWSEGRR